jgi:hypothetical protein
MTIHPNFRPRLPRGFKPVKRRDNKTSRKRMELLERRREHLLDRIMDPEKRSTSWDEEEEAALRWALDVLDEWIELDPLFEIDWSSERVDNASLQDLVNLLGLEAIHDGHRHEIVEVRFADGQSQRKVARLTLQPLQDRELPQRRRRGQSNAPLVIEARPDAVLRAA